MQQMRKMILGIDDTREETDLSVKENVKAKMFLSQNIQEIWDTMEKPNLRIIGTEEGKESQFQGLETTIKKIREKKIPTLKKEMPINLQEAYTTPNRQDEKKILPPYSNQNTKYMEQRKNFKSYKGKRPRNN